MLIYSNKYTHMKQQMEEPMEENMKNYTIFAIVIDLCNEK